MNIRIQNWWSHLMNRFPKQNQYYIFIDAKHSNLGGMAGMGVPLQMGAVPLDQDGSISISTNGRGNYWLLTIEFLPLSYLANIDFWYRNSWQASTCCRPQGRRNWGWRAGGISDFPTALDLWSLGQPPLLALSIFCRCLNQTNRIFFSVKLLDKSLF